MMALVKRRRGLGGGFPAAAPRLDRSQGNGMTHHFIVRRKLSGRACLERRS